MEARTAAFFALVVVPAMCCAIALAPMLWGLVRGNR